MHVCTKLLGSLRGFTNLLYRWGFLHIHFCLSSYRKGDAWKAPIQRGLNKASRGFIYTYIHILTYFHLSSYIYKGSFVKPLYREDFVKFPGVGTHTDTHLNFFLDICKVHKTYIWVFTHLHTEGISQSSYIDGSSWSPLVLWGVSWIPHRGDAVTSLGAPYTYICHQMHILVFFSTDVGCSWGSHIQRKFTKTNRALIQLGNLYTYICTY